MVQLHSLKNENQMWRLFSIPGLWLPILVAVTISPSSSDARRYWQHKRNPVYDCYPGESNEAISAIAKYYRPFGQVLSLAIGTSKNMKSYEDPLMALRSAWKYRIILQVFQGSETAPIEKPSFRLTTPSADTAIVAPTTASSFWANWTTGRTGRTGAVKYDESSFKPKNRHYLSTTVSPRKTKKAKSAKAYVKFKKMTTKSEIDPKEMTTSPSTIQQKTTEVKPSIKKTTKPKKVTSTTTTTTTEATTRKRAFVKKIKAIKTTQQPFTTSATTSTSTTTTVTTTLTTTLPVLNITTSESNLATPSINNFTTAATSNTSKRAFEKVPEIANSSAFTTSRLNATLSTPLSSAGPQYPVPTLPIDEPATTQIPSVVTVKSVYLQHVRLGNSGPFWRYAVFGNMGPHFQMTTPKMVNKMPDSLRLEDIFRYSPAPSRWRYSNTMDSQWPVRWRPMRRPLFEKRHQYSYRKKPINFDDRLRYYIAAQSFMHRRLPRSASLFTTNFKFNKKWVIEIDYSKNASLFQEVACILLSQYNRGSIYFLPWTWSTLLKGRQYPSTSRIHHSSPLGTIINLCLGKRPPGSHLINFDAFKKLTWQSRMFHMRYHQPLYVASLVDEPLCKLANTSSGSNNDGKERSGILLLCGSAIYPTCGRYRGSTPIQHPSCDKVLKAIKDHRHHGKDLKKRSFGMWNRYKTCDGFSNSLAVINI